MKPEDVPPILDKHGRAIEPHDVLKVFHFQERRKKHYMYKQVILGPEGFLRCTHLDGTDSWFDARVLRDGPFEIVQSKNWRKLEKRTPHA